MPADFSTAAKRARLQIAVPPIDIELVRRRSRAQRASERLRRLGISIAVSLGIAGSAVALAATFSQGIHVWIFGNTVKATVQSFAQVRAPMAADVERIFNSAAFPATIPAGVPKAYRVIWIAYSPADHPTLIQVSYRQPSGAAAMNITAIQTSSIERNRALLSQSSSPHTTSHGYTFEVGAETILVGGPHAATAELASVKRAMQSDSVAQAKADMDSHLTRLLVLAPVPSIPLELAAERVAPNTGKNILLARWALHELPARAAHNQPLRDPRPIEFTNVPSAHGEPDYRKATVAFARPIAIPADGVRVIESALRRAKIGPNCACGILVHQAAGAYSLWQIDAKTLKASRLQ